MKERDPEMIRAVYHFFLMLATVFAFTYVPRTVGVIGFIVIVIISLSVEYFRKYDKRFKFIIDNKLFKYIIRDKERKGRTTNVDGTLGLAIAYLFFPLSIFQTVTLILGISDPLARVIGRLYGYNRLPKFFEGKTWEGSFSFFLSAVWVSSFFVSSVAAVVGAIVATIAEAWPEKWAWLGDNFNCPTLTALTLVIMC